MNWISLSILTAVFVAVQSVLQKRSMQKLSEYTMSFASSFFPIIFLLIFLVVFSFTGNTFIEKFLGSGTANVFAIPHSFREIPFDFWKAIIIAGPLGVIATLLFLRALKNSDLSIALPLVTFTPVFTLIISPIMLGKTEIPNFWGVIGVLLIFLGAYVLNIKERHAGLWAPFKILLKNKEAVSVLIVSLLYAIGSVYSKTGSQSTSSLFWALSINSITVVVLFPICMYRARKRFEKGLNILKVIKKALPVLLIIGLLNTLANICQLTAVQLGLVAYVIAIKRAGIIFALALGYIFFKERDIKERMTGAALMVAGVIFLTVFK